MYTVYGKPACAYCEAAKRTLTTKGLPFNYIDISTDDSAREFVVTENKFKTVPMITLDGELVGGFNELKNSLT